VTKLPKTADNPRVIKTTNPEDTILLPAQVADLLYTTEASLAQMRSRGNGPKFIKMNSRILYRLSDIRAYLDANTVTRTGEQSTVFAEPAVNVATLRRSDVATHRD
jgi:hypothetical protein